jgi:epoxyqueuosine reductase
MKKRSLNLILRLIFRYKKQLISFIFFGISWSVPNKEVVVAKNKEQKKRYHSLAGRRDFMKVLGIGAMATAGNSFGTSFRGVDEMMSSPIADRNLPFWVKEVDEPTVEIDWENMEVFANPMLTLFNRSYWEKGEWEKIRDKNLATTTEKVRNKVPGYSLRDRALGDANCWGWGLSEIAPSWTGPEVKPNFNWEHPAMLYTPEDFGVPRYEGTPEENSRMLRVAGRIMGAADVGFVKLNDRAKKLLYGMVQFEKVEKGYQKPNGMKILPDKDLWVICSVIPQSLWMAQYTDRMSWAQSNTAAYSRAGIFSNRIKVFLRGLGYEHYGGGTADVGRAVGFGVLSGMAEYGRIGIMVSPQYGANITITDLPLAETRPIDAGITNFCRTCKKCAERCPAGAISMEDEPFWGGDAPWQAKGIKGWYSDIKKCFEHVFGGDPDCSICQAVCPFSKFDRAVIHDLVRMSISSTPALNRILRKLDDIFGYGTPRTGEVWDIDPKDIPLFGLDTSRS